MTAKVDRMVGEMKGHIDAPESLQIRQAVVLTLDSLNTCLIDVGGDPYPAIHWIGAAPSPGQTVWVLSHGARGKDFLVLGPQS